MLKVQDYSSLTEAESLEDVKSLLTSFYPTLTSTASGTLSTSSLSRQLQSSLVSEFGHLKTSSVEPLTTFFDFISHGYVIDNVVLLLQAALKAQRAEAAGGGAGGRGRGAADDEEENAILAAAEAHLHPCGMFESIRALAVAQSVSELYRLVLIDSPLAPYIQEGRLAEEDLSEINVEVLRATLSKAWLEAFAAFCEGVGGSTAEAMTPLLAFEADRRAINITLNSLGTELSTDDRARLYPQLGSLYPDGHLRLSRADSPSAVRQAVEHVGPLAHAFASASTGTKSLEDAFFEEEVRLCKEAFNVQFGFGVFYAYVRLREQEHRNVLWITECIAQRQRSQLDHYVRIF
jgi:V-type H+-transporting ATPase subunit d